MTSSDEWIYEPGTVPPPPRSPDDKQTLWGDIKQGVGYVQFVLKMSSRIRSWRNRVRFVIGLILWRPILPDEE
ncbi:MAG TPA: hypothetical protein V6D10_00070 [Trichocoleus sp.]|jgi:hypothetical protein